MAQALALFSNRLIALGIAAVSGAAMFYVGLYQSRAVEHLYCPIFDKGCQVVADAPFARPFGIPDGYLAAGLYGVIIALLFALPQNHWAWIVLLALASMATLANILGVLDMAHLGSFCFYCLTTTVLSPLLLWLIWELR